MIKPECIVDFKIGETNESSNRESYYSVSSGEIGLWNEIDLSKNLAQDISKNMNDNSNNIKLDEVKTLLDDPNKQQQQILQ
ncbi:unnamed protein product, partial [Brachionus calyciflorus]